MTIVTSGAGDKAPRRTARRVLAGTAAFSTGLVGMGPAFAAELVTAELVGTHNVIEVEQGRSANFTIALSAIDKAACGSAHTAKVKNAFSIAAGGAVSTGAAFSDAVTFSAPGNGTNCDITGGGTVNATISAAASTVPGTYTATLSTAAGTTQVTSSNATGGKLEDGTATTLTFRVLAPANSAPVAGPAPAAANGVEGSTLTTSGSFTDVDGNLSSVAITSGAGTLAAARDAANKLTGAWTWSLATTDDESGSVTVTARDAAGATATQTFTYASTNRAPQISAAASSPSGNEGDTLLSGGRFEDVSGDAITIRQVSGDGTFVDNRNGTWSWSLGTTNESSGSVVVEATDGDGGTTQDRFTYAAANVAPNVQTPAEDPSGNEGTVLNTSGAFADVADALEIAGTGAGTVVGGTTDGAWSWSYQAGDNGTGSVRVTADDGTTTADDDFTWTVHNVAPTVAAGANDARGAEGTQLIAGGRFSDPVDTVSIRKISGPGTVTAGADGAWSWSFDATDDLTENVVVEAGDGDGGTVTDTFAVTVDNAAPTVSTSAADATGSEGNTLVASGGFTDVPADTVTITKTAGEGSVVTHADGTWSWSLDTADQTSGSVTITARDEDGGSVTDTFDYQAVDVAPQLVREARDATGNEGDTLTTSGAFQDVAADAIRIVQVSGPGTVTDNGGGEWSYSLPTTNQISGTVVVKAVDKDDVESVTDTFAVEAANVAPAVDAAPADQSDSEGATLATRGSFTDPADAITITKESGEGTLTVGADGAWSWTLATTDDARGTVVVKADDGDGGVTRSTFAYTATNVAPVLSDLAVTGATGTACVTGSKVDLSFTVADPGAGDTMSGTIDWGNGQTTPFTSRSVVTSHTYSAAGTYTIRVTVSDDDGGAAAAKTASVSRNFAVGAIQSPINADGTSVFKHGSTVPVKVRITDCTNAPVSGLAPTIKVERWSSTTPATAVNETGESTSAADTTGVMRYDSATGNYIYNLATKSLTDGDAKYTVTAAIANHTPASQKFGLRTR